MIINDIDVDDLLYFAARCNSATEDDVEIHRNRFKLALESYVEYRVSEKSLVNKIREEFENANEESDKEESN